MPAQFDSPEFDALVSAIAAKLASKTPANPGTDAAFMPTPDGTPLPQIPWDPPAQLPDPLIPKRRLGLLGVELTQSTQHQTAGEHRGSYGDDNSVPLVALKSMVVRVYPYVRPGIASPDTLSGSRVTGELVLSIGNQVVYRTSPTSSQGVRVGRSEDIFRDLWDTEFVATTGDRLAMKLREYNCPLNFYVPAYFCRKGRMHLSVHIWRANASSDSVSHTEYIDFLDVAAPKLALVRVNWDDGTGTITRPTDASMLATFGQAQRMLPFPYFETTILALEETRSGAFAMPVANGACNASWNSLLATLGVTSIFTALFQLGDIVIGMVPAAVIPAGATSINAGCRTTAAGVIVGQQTAIAHELGHYYGRAHIAVPGDPQNDPDYPNYGGKRRAIGETGIDTGTSPPTLYAGDSSVDLMAYSKGEPQWISPYTYRAILDARATHQSAPATPGKVRPFLVTLIRIHRTDDGFTRVELKKQHLVHAPGSAPLPAPDAVSLFSIDLVDANRNILGTHHTFYQAPTGGCGCSGHAHSGRRCACGNTGVPLEREPYLDLAEAIPWPEDAAAIHAIAFHRGGRPFAVLDAGEAPSISLGSPSIEGNALRVRIRADHPRQQPSVVVLFTGDDGASWQPVAHDPADGEVVLDVDRLTGGDRCRLRAVATAELRSAEADSDPFRLPPSRRRLFVVTPDDECGIKPGPVTLRAVIDANGLGTAAPHQIRWSSELVGELGTGYEINPELGEGTHILNVTAPDGRGGTLSERAIIIIGGKGR